MRLEKVGWECVEDATKLLQVCFKDASTVLQNKLDVGWRLRFFLEGNDAFCFLPGVYGLLHSFRTNNRVIERDGLGRLCHFFFSG